MNCPDAGAGNSGSTDPAVIEVMVSTPALLTLEPASEIGIIYCKCISPRLFLTTPPSQYVPHPHPGLPSSSPFFFFYPLSFKVVCNMSKWKIQLLSNSAASFVHLGTPNYSTTHLLFNTRMLDYIKQVMRMVLFKHELLKAH